MSYHKNLEVIARGKGSPQARYEDELDWGEAGEWDVERYLGYLTKKGTRNESIQSNCKK